MDFKCFDVVTDDSDHHYLRTHVGGNCFSDTKINAVYKSIMKELKILEQYLLPSDFIYVRAYKRRIDLLRAVIVGARGTPYHDGLFFFDIAIPNDYPNKPPKVYYHSFGLRLNPKLYDNGKVCLSLLNTWSGRKEEMWDPQKSTLLQVLLSIQVFVLNEKPYFNTTHDRGKFDDRSCAYNEYAFFYTCQTSLNLIRRPPKNFESFVSDHFRCRGLVILSACREYVNTNAVLQSVKLKGKISLSFHEMLKGVYIVLLMKLLQYRRMYDAFVQCGASLEPSLKTLVLELETKPIKSNRGIFKKAVDRIKKGFGLNKKKKTTATTNDSTQLSA